MLPTPNRRRISANAAAREHRRRLGIGTMALMAVVMSCLVSTQLRAQDGADPAAGGALMLQGKEGAAMPAVRLGTDMDVTVTGQILRVRVTQAFRNTSNEWMEATYLYPLPDDGAVDTLNMVVGQRVIVGKIAEREEARQIYDQARSEGRKAGLVESSRPNLFRNSVANIGPGETVLVSIEYQAPVRQLAGEFALRLPLVVGPRYVPPHTLTDGAARADAAQVTAPLASPALGNSLNPVSITVHLAPGFVPANIISPYHRISVADAGAQARTITLAAGEEPADRDFELRWRSASADPTLGLFRQTLGGQDYVMAAITPQAEVEAGKLPPREMIFVIDNSGSMSGGSMEAAKESLLHALTTLRPEDRFNIIRFDDTLTALFDHATLASAEQVALARRFTEDLKATGGTEMLPALRTALTDDRPTDKALRQVIFLTDGDLSNEKEMMAEIAANGGRSSVFMIGIGSAPNNFLMRRMAEAGRGTYTNIGTGDEVMAKMTALLERLKAPAMRDISVRVEGTSLELAPRVLPTLYAGEPLVLLGPGDGLEGRLVVSGTIGDRRWSQTVELKDAADSPSVARLWANRRVADVEAQRWSQEISEDEADGAVRELGLGFHIVTSQTSLVAVDETPSRPQGARLTQEELPLLLPSGWNFDALFGGDAAQTVNRAAPPEQMQELDLPQTGTGFVGTILRGLALLLAGIAGLLTWRRRGTRVEGEAA
ncbi:marine proteobacterial sortase target protein [Croceibacterium xixiisoli]|nr:marine proteobacterial sortase target protein [Croceibacterium xixiisoli]